MRMWEWSHAQPVQSVRPPGVFAKVNRVRFTSQGNKFGACDGDGNVALWQAANASQPFFVSKSQGPYSLDSIAFWAPVSTSKCMKLLVIFTGN